MRQIAAELKMCTKTVSSIITGSQRPKKEKKPSIICPFLRLIRQWYEQHPNLKAIQIYERLKNYGYRGEYGMVCVYTKQYRQKKRESYHELDFLPGEATLSMVFLTVRSIVLPVLRVLELLDLRA